MVFNFSSQNFAGGNRDWNSDGILIGKAYSVA